MEYVLLDFETTGLDPTDSEIIEIGAIRVRGLEAIDRFHRLVKPKGHLPEAITRLTGITPEMLEDQPSLEAVSGDLVAFLGDSPIVAHNSSLEQSFLDHHLPSAGPFVVHNSISPLAMLLPDHSSHSMESMRKWAGVAGEGAHRADQDCEDLLAVMIHAQAWMKVERPWIGRIVRDFLEGHWWWTWFFEGVTGDNPKREDRGDLKSLRSEDSSRVIAWGEAVGGVDTARVHSALETVTEGFRYREAQERMAQVVREALAKGERVAIEAPTGTGKSVAYLLPGVLVAEASGAPLVVSTHSKSLQDQLLEKDIPIVSRLIGKPVRATTVKGQENYLCLRKLNDLAESVTEESSEDERWAVAYLVAFASVTSVAELDRVSHYLKVQYPSLMMALDRARSHRTTTIGPGCPFYKQCHFFDSARIAHQSDVVIANHALVFQWPANLPQIRNVVFDEAHHLEDRITEAYSTRLSEEELAEGLDRLEKKRGKRAVGELQQIERLLARLGLERDLGAKLETVRSRLSHLRMIVPLAIPAGPSSDGYEQMIDLSRKGPSMPALIEAVGHLAGALMDVKDTLVEGVAACEKQSHPKNDPAFDSLTTQADRFASFESRVRSLMPDPTDVPTKAPNAAAAANFLRLLWWHPRESTWRLQVAPIEVAGLAEPFFAGKRAVALTSATLSAGAQQTFVTDRIGLALSKPFVSLPSPYTHDRQAVLYMPENLPPPGTPSHLEALIAFTEQVTSLLGGRTLLLMTSNRRLKHAADVLRTKLGPRGITVFDSLSDRRAAEAFRGAERGLLIGGERYGEGLDIPGKALTCVIVEKINEAMTRSPLAEARKSRTKFALYDYDFPLRTMWLKQRVGRLIRSQEDTGAVIVFDSRYHAWSLGSRSHVVRAVAPIPIRGGGTEAILHELEKLQSEGRV